MGIFLRWSWLLVLALILPIALPAGGFRGRSDFSRGDSLGPFLAGNNCVLRVSPLTIAPALRRLQVGTPLRVVRAWRCLEGKNWLQVQLESSQLMGANNMGGRGWINV